MGFLDVFKRGRSSVVIGSRTFSLTVAGYGVEARPRLPMAAAHLADGTVVFGPYDVAGARAQGKVDNVLIRPGTPPAGELARQTIGANSIVTYSTTQRGSTQLVLGVGMTDYSPVLEDVRCADHGARWRILTDDHEVAWPATLVLRADGNLSGRAGYELALDGSADKVIAPHGPYIGDGIRRPENLISPGQSWGDAGTLDGAARTVRWYTVSHVLGGTTWLMRYYYIPLDATAIYLVRAQTTADSAAALFGASDFVARTLTPRF